MTAIGLGLTTACAAGPSSAPPALEPSAPLARVTQAAVEQGYPGAVVAVLDTSGRLRVAASGLEDRARGLAMAPLSAVHGGSTGKAFTATVILRLVDRGLLTLDAVLPDLLPPSIHDLVPGAERITVLDLLRHTSGIYAPNNDPVYVARYIGPRPPGWRFWTPGEIVAFAARPGNDPAFAPGAGTSYSDINYVLLGLIVEAVTGRPFREVVHDEILDPLRLTDTWFLSERPGALRARAYTRDSRLVREFGLDPALVADADSLVDTTDRQEESDAAAGLVTTMPDLVRFAAAMLLGDLLSPRSRAVMLEVREALGERDEALAVLHAHRVPSGVIVTAEGNGPGTHAAWALDLATGRIAAAAINHFGAFDEEEYLLGIMLPGALGID